MGVGIKLRRKAESPTALSLKEVSQISVRVRDLTTEPEKRTLALVAKSAFRTYDSYFNKSS
jgi:hypothetical protein